MRTIRRFRNPIQLSYVGLAALALIAVCFTSCKSPHRPTRRTQASLEPGWPKPDNYFHQVSYQTVRGTIPDIADAEYVNDDSLCAQCHSVHTTAFGTNVHRGIHEGQSCEACHGPASQHLKTRGKEPGTIIGFKNLSPADKSEVCLKCHEQNRCAPGAQWRTSKHAACGVSCLSCHNAHYDVPPGTPTVTEVQEGAGGGGAPTAPVPPGPIPPGPVPPGPVPPGPIPPGPTTQNTTPGQPLPALNWNSQNTTTLRRLPVVRGQDGNLFQTWARSASWQQPSPSEAPAPVPAQPGSHMPSRNLGAVAPYVCYQCHGSMQQHQQVAGPHQICGPNGFNCTTCHDAHGNLLEYSREELCLQCHKGAPTMAWHSATHSLEGVACTDCHNPHPCSNLPRVANIYHTHLERRELRQMSVQQPEACYKCHPKIFAQNALPSHHPIKEGKMVCSDCHDAHGQEAGNLVDSSTNLVCYKCHADKQGPFVWEHPPVTEDCAICHEPHGTVANNLLRQPPTFLCLRCHVGHRGEHGRGARTGIDQRPALQLGYYTDCTQCHQQIHGSDIKGNGRFKDFMR